MAKCFKVILSFSILFLAGNCFSCDKNNYACTGKVLIVSGIQSSGKTTLVQEILKEFPHYKTIDRQKIIYTVMEIFYGDLFKEVKKITGIEIKSILHYNSIIPEKLESPAREKFIKLKKKNFNMLIESKDDFLRAVFLKYSDEIRKNLSSGFNTIIDDALLSYDQGYDILLSYCKGIRIKRVLLFNTMEEILQKCTIRNSKFLKPLDFSKDINFLITEMEKKAITHGGSQSSYRWPHSIVEDYRKFYEFKSPSNSEDIILAKSTRKSARKTLQKINVEQLKLLKILTNNNSIMMDKTYIENKLDQIFGKKNEVNIVSKGRFDYVIRASEIKDLSNKSNLLSQFREIFEWLDSPCDSANPDSF